MNTNEALDILSQVAAAYVGTLKEHNQIQAALTAIETALATKQK
jgi:hypothetical protein